MAARDQALLELAGENSLAMLIFIRMMTRRAIDGRAPPFGRAARYLCSAARARARVPRQRERAHGVRDVRAYRHQVALYYRGCQQS